MIVGCYFPLEIGQIYKIKVTDAKCNIVDDVIIRVLSKATVEDYLNWCKEAEACHSMNFDNALFYKVITD